MVNIGRTKIRAKTAKAARNKAKERFPNMVITKVKLVKSAKPVKGMKTYTIFMRKTVRSTTKRGRKSDASRKSQEKHEKAYRKRKAAGKTGGKKKSGRKKAKTRKKTPWTKAKRRAAAKKGWKTRKRKYSRTHGFTQKGWSKVRRNLAKGRKKGRKR